MINNKIKIPDEFKNFDVYEREVEDNGLLLYDARKDDYFIVFTDNSVSKIYSNWGRGLIRDEIKSGLYKLVNRHKKVIG